MFSATLLDHFQNPRNVGELPPPALVVEAANPVCGDILRLSVLLESGRVREARFQVRGCTASIAAGSALTEMVRGKTVQELSAITSSDVEATLDGLIPESKHAAVLCVDAIRAVLSLAARRFTP